MPYGEQRQFLVVDQGREIGPLTQEELGAYRNGLCNLLYDSPRNELRIRHQDERGIRCIPLGSRVRRGKQRQPVFRTGLELLRLMAEHPGEPFSKEIICQQMGREWENQTLARYIMDLRLLLGDDRTSCPLIETVAGVDRGISSTGCAYRANPANHFRVILYSELLH